MDARIIGRMPESLAARVKCAALAAGVVRAGIAGLEALAGPPTADPAALLPGARSVVSFLAVEPEEAILGYLSKRDASTYRNHFFDNLQTLGRAGVAVAALLQREGFRAVAVSPNGVYEPGSNVIGGLKPAFSHRYAAVAAGLGMIGLSGNVMTPISPRCSVRICSYSMLPPSNWRRIVTSSVRPGACAR